MSFDVLLDEDLSSLEVWDRSKYTESGFVLEEGKPTHSSSD